MADNQPDSSGGARYVSRSRRPATYRLTQAAGVMDARGAALVRRPAMAVLITGMLHVLCSYYMLPQGRYVAHGGAV